MPKEVFHVVKPWEKKWKRLVFGDLIPRGKLFKMRIGLQDLERRFVDKGGRIWIGSSMDSLTVGKTYVVTVDDACDEVIMRPTDDSKPSSC